jgi:hypothetical protein
MATARCLGATRMRHSETLRHEHPGCSPIRPQIPGLLVQNPDGNIMYAAGDSAGTTYSPTAAPQPVPPPPYPGVHVWFHGALPALA